MNTLVSYLHQEYYRQTPPKVPSFLKTLFRRKLVLWFLASEILRDYWLSGVSLRLCCFDFDCMLTPDV
jgi:alpha-1,3-glucan synthase